MGQKSAISKIKQRINSLYGNFYTFTSSSKYEYPSLNLPATDEQVDNIINFLKKAEEEILKYKNESTGDITEKYIEMPQSSFILNFNDEQILKLFDYIPMHQALDFLKSKHYKVSNMLLDHLLSDEYILYVNEWGHQYIYFIKNILEYYVESKIIENDSPETYNQIIELYDKKIFPELLNKKELLIKLNNKEQDDANTSVKSRLNSRERKEPIFKYDNYENFLFDTLLDDDSLIYVLSSAEFIRKYSKYMTANTLYKWFRVHQDQYCQFKEEFTNIIKDRIKYEVNDIIFKGCLSKPFPGLKINIEWDLDQTLLFDSLESEGEDRACIEKY